MGLLSLGGISFIHRPEFGRLPQGERLARIQASPHYVNGQFSSRIIVMFWRIAKAGNFVYVAIFYVR